MRYRIDAAGKKRVTLTNGDGIGPEEAGAQTLAAVPDTPVASKGPLQMPVGARAHGED